MNTTTLDDLYEQRDDAQTRIDNAADADNEAAWDEASDEYETIVDEIAARIKEEQ